ncbi:uncharacterized protein LOC135097079 isoform X1 [Scylla paramamosain]|uniref:uncharacterized protein LOC135097079 isoform X1 n=1 Tax=Scylla paramamosain TaxID=85552 RepID=UPI00308386E4
MNPSSGKPREGSSGREVKPAVYLWHSSRTHLVGLKPVDLFPVSARDWLYPSRPLFRSSGFSGQLVVHRDSEKLGTLDHLEGVRAHCELGRGHWYRGGTAMHHHSFAVVDGHPALFRPRLQSLQNCLQWRVVLVLGGNWDAHGAVVHILPAMRGVGEGVVNEEEEA